MTIIYIHFYDNDEGEGGGGGDSCEKPKGKLLVFQIESIAQQDKFNLLQQKAKMDSSFRSN